MNRQRRRLPGGMHGDMDLRKGQRLSFMDDVGGFERGLQSLPQANVPACDFPEIFILSDEMNGMEGQIHGYVGDLLRGLDGRLHQGCGFCGHERDEVWQTPESAMHKSVP